MLHKARAGLSVDDIIVANYIATGSVWGQHNKSNAGDDADHHCLHCGAPHQDFFHTVCECPALKPVRDKHLASDLGGLDFSKLPKSLLLGLPPALCPDPTHTYWGQAADQIGQCSSEVIKSFGIKAYPRALSEWGFTLEGYVNAMSRNGFSSTNKLNDPNIFSNARQIIVFFRGDGVISDPRPPVEHCELPAPDAVNVFGDGGVLHPTMTHFRLGTYSVWHPQRFTALTETEADYNLSNYHFKFRKAKNSGPGLALQGVVRGPICSSTRTELVGFINAVLAPGPVHYACDNAAVVLKGRAILQDPFLDPCKPWGLCRDGDLWDVLQHVIRSKNPKSIAISKVKGHATDQHVLDGLSTPLHKQGNDAGDEIATDALQFFGAGFLSLTNLCATRLTEYACFMAALTRMLVDIYKTDRDLRARIQSQQIAIGRGPKQLHSIPTFALAYADPAVARPVGLYPYSYVPRAHCHASELCYRQVWSFLAILRVCPVISPQSGVTWIELLIIFNMLGGPQDLSRRELTQCLRPHTTKQELVFFQSAVRAVVKHFVREDDQSLFKAPPTVQKRLLAVGFFTHAAKLAFLPLLSPAQQSQVTKALLALRGRFTNADAAAYSNGTLKLARIPLTLRRQPMWRKHLHISNQLAVGLPPPHPPDQDHRPQRRADQVTCLEARQFFDTFRLVCRACNSHRACVNVIPRSGYTWAKLTCSACHKVTPANLWWCSCLTPWRSCPTHSCWPSRAQALALLPPLAQALDHAKDLHRGKAALDSRHVPPPVLPAKRARTVSSTPVGSASSSTAPADSTARLPKRAALAQLDQQLATRRLLAKMPKLAAKFPHLVQPT